MFNKKPYSHHTESLDDLQRLWAFRAVVDLDGMNQLVNGKTFRSDTIARQLGLDPDLIKRHGKKGVKEQLNAMLAILEETPAFTVITE